MGIYWFIKSSEDNAVCRSNLRHWALGSSDRAFPLRKESWCGAFLLAAMSLLALLVLPVTARLGERPGPEELLRGGAARRLEYWDRRLSPNLSLPVLQGMMKDLGYEHLATTTRYGNTCCASCGSVNTADLVNGTGLYAVASAESMQTGGIGDGCSVEWGEVDCQCQGHYCTKSAQSQDGTFGMGCLSCAKGRFLPSHPMAYPMWAQPDNPIFKEVGAAFSCV